MADLSRCRKFGFKNVQAHKTWHGMFSYRDHDNVNSRVDSAHSMCGGCNAHDIEYEQTTPASTKYLSQHLQCVYSTGDAFPHSTGADVNRTSTVGRYTGLTTSVCSDSGSDPTTIQAALDLLYQHANYGTGFAGAILYFTLQHYAVSPYSTSCSTSGVNTTVSITDTSLAGSPVVFSATLDSATGAYSSTWTDYNPDLSVADGGAESLSFTATTFHHHWESYNNDASFPPATETWDVYGTLSNPYTSADLYADLKTLMSQWPLSDDLVYPYRTDELLGVAPIVSYNEYLSAIVPGPVDCPYTDPMTGILDGSILGGPLTTPGTDTGHFDYLHKTIRACIGSGITQHYKFAYGAFAGQTNAGDVSDSVVPKTATRWSENWWWESPTIPTTMSTNTAGDGMWQGQFGGSGTDTGTIALAAPIRPFTFLLYGPGGARTTDDGAGHIKANGVFAAGGTINYTTGDYSIVTSPAEPSPDVYTIIFQTTASLGGGTFNTGFPPSLQAGYLPGGAWLLYWGGVLWGQKWCEVKIHAQEQDWFRPCGADRYAMDESTVQCVQAGSTAASLSVHYAAPSYVVNDLVWICGVSGVTDGVYKVTVKNTTTNYTVVLQTVSPGYTYSGDCSTAMSANGIIGKLRWPTTAWPICGQLAISAVTGGTPIEITMGLPTMLSTGDSVTISGATGTLSINGTWTITVIDATHFTLNTSSGTGTSSGGLVASAGAPSPTWESTKSIGKVVYAVWDHNTRDFIERERVIGQYAYCGSCSDAAPASSTHIRPYQELWGMPRSVKTFTTEEDTILFDVCNPQVLCITPNGETFNRCIVKAFPATFTSDDRYGAFWQAAWVQWMPDPLWQIPHEPCASTGVGGYNDTAPCAWVMDDFSCQPDACPPPLVGTDMFYPHWPPREARTGLPAGAPSLPSGCYVGYLTLTDLDTPSQPSGNVLAPPTGPGYGLPITGDDVQLPIAVASPWAEFIRAVDCQCLSGRWETLYAAMELTGNCP